MPNDEQIILVDAGDAQIGAMGKLEAHEKGLLHRAFSIFVKNNKGEVMLQKRASDKYHSGGLWSNTCCGHPRDGEELISAAHRRLKEEMGFDCPLREISTLVYEADVDCGLKENEFLHIFIGEYNNAPTLNPREASDWKWAVPDDVVLHILKHPEEYTYWFKIILGRMGKTILHTLETK